LATFEYTSTGIKLESGIYLAIFSFKKNQPNLLIDIALLGGIRLISQLAEDY
jgi:hypothetical protein